jgi:hypothetical protein
MGADRAGWYSYDWIDNGFDHEMRAWYPGIGRFSVTESPNRSVDAIAAKTLHTLLRVDRRQIELESFSGQVVWKAFAKRRA